MSVMSALFDVHNLVGQIITKNGIYDASASTTRTGITVRVTVKRPKQCHRKEIRYWQVGFETRGFSKTLKEIKRELRQFIAEMEEEERYRNGSKNK